MVVLSGVCVLVGELDIVFDLFGGYVFCKVKVRVVIN